MQHICVLIVTGAIASLSSILILGLPVDAQTSPTAAEKRDGPSSEATAIAPKVKDKNFYLSAISKAIADEASRLKNDAAGWGQKLQELELDLSKNQQDVGAAAKDIDECLLVLRAAADRLAPDEATRAVMRKQEGAIRDLASRAEVHSDPEVRKTAGYFQQKTTELHALNRSVEEIRTRLVTQMDRLEELKIQLEFNRTAAQIGEAVKGGEASLDDMQAIAEDARRIAADLDGFGRAPAVLTDPAEAAKPVEVAKPAELKKRIPGTLRNGPRSRIR